MGETDREAFERREAETALTRARGHVAELRRMYERGAGFVEAHPLFEQLEADLNTVRPQHSGNAVDWQGNALHADGTRRTDNAYAGTNVEPGSMASQPAGAYDLGYQGDSQPTASGVAAVQGPPVVSADEDDDEIDDEDDTAYQGPDASSRRLEGETADQRAARIRAE